MSFALASLRASVLHRRPLGWPILRLTTLLASFQLTIPSVNSLLDLFPPFLWAVPKKKVSHSRKAMRSAHKGLRDKSNITNCPGCGSAKLAHHLCPHCYSQISREHKRSARESIPLELEKSNNDL